MKTYLEIVAKYQQASPRKARLTVFSVALAVALVTTIFSMMDVFQRSERVQVIKETGNYHLMIEDITAAEKAAVAGRVDVKNSGEWVMFAQGAVNGIPCRLAAVDENYAANMRVDVVEGRFPTRPDELILERWALETFRPPLQIGDQVTVRFSDGQERAFTISGLFEDFASTKAAASPGVVISMAAAREVNVLQKPVLLVEMKDGVNVPAARRSIQSTLGIAEERIHQNERLLVVMGQSRIEMALSLYATAAVLFCIVLAAGVVMIYNTFNISVIERVRQFGLLRCIGASKAQIRAIVRREGLRVTARAVPLGALVGVLVTFACSALLKFYNAELFGDIPLFTISPPGLAAGAVVGVLTVAAATVVPANKAASVSPVNAVTGGSDPGVSLKKKSSLIPRLFPAEVALGINNAFARKKTLALMTASLALSIILFFGFNVFVHFLHTMLKTTKPYTPDVSIVSEQGLSRELYAQVAAHPGVERAYGRMFGYVTASFDAALLNQGYIDEVGGVELRPDGSFIPPEPSWLISYDEPQLGWARQDLVAGTLDAAALDRDGGIVAVIFNLRRNISSEPVRWRLGERVTIETPAGPVEKTVMGILRAVPFGDSNLNLTTLITTEKQFTELTGDSTLDVIDIQLRGSGQEQTVREIRATLGPEMTLHDRRQQNREVDQVFFTAAVFVYGFVAVIAMISVLNVINTIQTSVASRTRYLGLMRAVGMTGKQLNWMALAEVGTYNLLGLLIGSALGVLLQKKLATDMLAAAHIRWDFPWSQLAVIAALTALVTVLAVIQPLRQVRSKGITEVIGSL